MRRGGIAGGRDNAILGPARLKLYKAVLESAKSAQALAEPAKARLLNHVGELRPIVSTSAVRTLSL